MPARENQKFLETLAQPRSSTCPIDPAVIRGRLFVVNLLDSYEEGTVQKEDVTSFLDECTSRPYGSTPGDALLIVKALSKTPRYSRLCRKPSVEVGSRLSTVCSYPDFARYLCRTDHTRYQERILPADGPDSNLDMETLERDIARITRSPKWFDPEAALGEEQPDPSSCWVSVNRFIDEGPESVYDGTESRADRTRDELGIVLDNGSGHLVQFTFSAESVAALSDAELARPTFADDGTWRFSAKHNCDRSRTMAEAGWGCAVHFALVPRPDLHPPTGNAIRVARPIKLSHLTNLQVDYLHRTKLKRWATSHAYDAAVLNVLLGNDRTIEDVLREITYFITPTDNDSNHPI